MSDVDNTSSILFLICSNASINGSVSSESVPVSCFSVVIVSSSCSSVVLCSLLSLFEPVVLVVTSSMTDISCSSLDGVSCSHYNQYWIHHHVLQLCQLYLHLMYFCSLLLSFEFDISEESSVVVASSFCSSLASLLSLLESDVSVCSIR